MRKRFLERLNFKGKEVRMMRKIFTIFGVFMAVMVLGLGTGMAFTLPVNTDVQAKYNNWDALSPFPIPVSDLDKVDPYTGAEFSWGILDVTRWQDKANPTIGYWTQGANNEYMTGMWYDLKLGMATWTGTDLQLYLYGGKMDLYLDRSDVAGYTQADPTLGKEGRIDASHYTNFTDSNVSVNPFLSLDFVPGIIVPALDPLLALGGTTFFISVSANSVVNTAGGDTYADVTGGDYAWLFDSNTLVNGSDFKLGFHGTGPSALAYKTGVTPFDADTFDPADGHTVPEPGTMLLLGTGLIGLARFARRKIKK